MQFLAQKVLVELWDMHIMQVTQLGKFTTLAMFRATQMLVDLLVNLQAQQFQRGILVAIFPPVQTLLVALWACSHLEH